MDAFFTLSGYVIALKICHDIRSGDFSVKRFWAGRITKLAPPAALVVIATVVLGLCFAPISEQRSLVEGALGALTGTYNWYAIQNSQDYFTTSEALTHFWSLAVEEQTYVFAPLALVLFYRCKLRWDRALLATIVASATVLSFSFALWLTHSSSAMLHYETFSRFWQFLVGAALAVLLPVNWSHQQLAKRYWNYCRTLDFLAVVGLLFSPFVPSGFSMLVGRILATIAVATIVSAGFSTFGVQRAFLRGPRMVVTSAWSCLVALGNHSYEVYLVHWPILYALRNWFSLGNKILLTFLFVVLTAVTTIAIGYCFSGSVGGKSSPKVPLRSAIAMSMAAVLVCLSVYGANVLANNMAKKTVLRNHQCVEESFRSAECRASESYFPTAWFAYQDF